MVRKESPTVANFSSTIEKFSARGGKNFSTFASFSPIAATRQLLLAALWLSEAATHLARAARGLDETTAWIAVTGAPAEVPWRIIDTAAHWIAAAGQLAGVSNRLDASFAVLYGNAAPKRKKRRALPRAK